MKLVIIIDWWQLKHSIVRVGNVYGLLFPCLRHQWCMIMIFIKKNTQNINKFAQRKKSRQFTPSTSVEKFINFHINKLFLHNWRAPTKTLLNYIGILISFLRNKILRASKSVLRVANNFGIWFEFESKHILRSRTFNDLLSFLSYLLFVVVFKTSSPEKKHSGFREILV